MAGKSSKGEGVKSFNGLNEMDRDLNKRGSRLTSRTRIRKAVVVHWLGSRV